MNSINDHQKNRMGIKEKTVSFEGVMRDITDSQGGVVDE